MKYHHCWILALSILGLSASFSEAAWPHDYADLPGPYCSSRYASGQCCPGRIDSCSVPILGTTCYCDDFCERRDNPDCCPDYWPVCMGITPAPGPSNETSCYHNGNYVGYGQSIKINCNVCECRQVPGTFGKTELFCTQDLCLIQPDVIESVNNGRLTWVASNYSEFWGRKLSEGLMRMGTLEPERYVAAMYPIKQHYDASRLPRSFDARQQWPGHIQDIRDQGWCASSWAFSTVAVAADRLALQTKGRDVYSFSAQNLISCNNRGQQGCNGGHLDRAWNHMRRIGVVNEECYPYSSGSTGVVEGCRVPRRATLLTMRCVLPHRKPNDPFGRTPPKDLFKTPPAYRVAPKEEDIMNEIYTRGPVQATMRVHPDFFMYRSGVYQYSNLSPTERTGYHSVRILGWGEEYHQGYSTKYWLVANSWGEQFGEGGTFKIVRGANEGDIEKFVLAVWGHSDRVRK